MPRNATTVLKDIGSYVSPEFSSVGVTGLAGGSGDNVEANGERHEVPDDAQSFALYIIWTATLAENETLSLSANVQDSTDVSGTGEADFHGDGTSGVGQEDSLPPTVVATGGSGGSTETGVTKVRYPDIRAHRGFLRSQTTGDLSRGATDTFEYSTMFGYGGMRTIPALV